MTIPRNSEVTKDIKIDLKNNIGEHSVNSKAL